MRPATDAPEVAMPAGQLLVDVRYQGKRVPGFQVMVLGDAPLQVAGQTDDEGWRTAFNGPVRVIAISHPEVNEHKWMTYTVPPADALRRSYQLDFTPPTAAPGKFNFTLDVRDGALVLDDRGRELLFEKH